MAKQSNTAAFGALFVALFGITFGFLAFVGATPNIVVDEGAEPISEQQVPVQENNPELPVRIVARDIGLDQSVSNPVSTDIGVLDRALLKGGVRYPTSAQLGTSGTVLIFGHSSYLPVVRNQAYKAFDGIQDLKPSQTISVYSGTTEYRYAVTGVKVADANKDVVELPQDGKHLTLVTCDSFGSKTNRFIVTANFVGEYPAQ